MVNVLGMVTLRRMVNILGMVSVLRMVIIIGMVTVLWMVTTMGMDDGYYRNDSYTLNCYYHMDGRCTVDSDYSNEW